MKATIYWLPVAPHPLASEGVTVGRGPTLLHAVLASKRKGVGLYVHRGPRSVCGVLPRHGWAAAFFLEVKCRRCEAAVVREIKQRLIVRKQTGSHGAKA